MKLNKPWNTDVSPPPPAAPNWFGAEIAHKSVAHQTSFEREFLTHPLIRRLLLGSRTSDFQWIKKTKHARVKDAWSKRFFKNNFTEWFGYLTPLKGGRDRTYGVQQKATCVCFILEQLSEKDLGGVKLEWDFFFFFQGSRLGQRKHHSKCPF